MKRNLLQMKYNLSKSFSLLLMFVCITALILNSCSKGDSGTPTPTPTPPVDPCAGKTISVSGATTVLTDPCSSNGKITISASGSTGFTYSLDGGTFQASNEFQSVSGGEHTITAKDAAGCSQSTKVTLVASAAGPLYTAVKNLMSVNCSSCHTGISGAGAKDLTTDCNIVTNKDRIKIRAVDGSPSFMPQGGKLSAADMKKITDWVNAGGRYSD
jgi:hypothetical protein